eukprot:scaffold40166_cov155-Skeletonema_dohrnii-CCMP3373.AAC.3
MALEAALDDVHYVRFIALYAHWHLLEAEIRDTSEQVNFAEACFVQMRKMHLTIPTEVEKLSKQGIVCGKTSSEKMKNS